MATHRTHGPRRALVGGLVALLVAACGSPSPSPSVVAPTPTLVADATATDTLRIGVPADPTGFLIPTDDIATQLVQRFLQAALYHLDDRLVPQPDLAAAAPTVSANGLTWQVTLAASRRFSDGSPVEAADVVRTYQLALQPDCPFGDLCDAIGQALTAVASPRAGEVVFTLSRPWAPFEADVLAQLPILPAAALDASLARLLDPLKAVTADEVTNLLGIVQANTAAPACAETPPPAYCDPTSYITSLTSLLAQAGVTPAAQASFIGSDGRPDATAYATALIGQVEAVSSVQAATGLDQQAAALPLLDLQAHPIGAGPFTLAADTPGQSVELTRWAVSPGAGAPAHIRLVTVSDATVAATDLQAGDLDWLPEVQPDAAPGLATSARLAVAERPSDTLRLLVFNVRAGHPYHDPLARQAFAACLDPRALASAAADAHLFAAADVLAVGSWAARGSLPWPSDATAATRALEAAGWARGSDGIYARDGLRLASSIAVRPGQDDLLAVLTAAATRLRACGIDLDVQSTTLSGSDILNALEYPNTFDTYLVSEVAGTDPDDALGRLLGSRATTVSHPGDANFGGWQDPVTDQLLGQGLRTADPVARAATYGQLEAHLAALVPVLPITWDAAWSAVARRVTDGASAVDPAAPGYDRDVLSWRLSAP
ncbi:MAG TPA: ABC transporter substrate-binding protein [Candidatus Sulfotelmatobacter sp.]|nr:ABC transporter substrate-binding protein [Candidatus Sulfotelmatobacter sp.]